jgi:alpha-galactosidase
VIAPDLGEALVVAASLGNGPRHTSPALRIPGLAPTAQYRSELVHVGREPRWALNRGVPRWLSEGVVSSGAGLAEIGLPMPPLLPASGILVHVRRTSS